MRGFTALQKNMDSASAAKPIGGGRVVIEETAIALNSRTFFCQPPCFLRDLGFQATSANGSSALATTGKQHACSRFTIRRTFYSYDSCKADFFLPDFCLVPQRYDLP